MNGSNAKYQLNRGLLAINILRGINVSYVFRACSILINLLVMYTMVNYLTPDHYGVWPIAIISVTWTIFFDLVLSMRLKKGLAVFLTTRRIKTGRSYVSNMYARIGLVIGLLFITFLILTRYINWHEFLNADHLSNSELNKIIFVIFTFVSLRVLFSLIGVLFATNQLPVVYDRINFISSILALMVIYILTFEATGYLTYLRLTIYSAPLVVFFFTSSILLHSRLKSIEPTSKRIYWKTQK